MLSLSLTVAGTEAAHWVAFRLTYPDPHMRAEALAGSGHHYLQLMPTVLSLAGALSVVLLATRTFSNRPSALRISPTFFFLLAPACFIVQECGEQLAAGTSPLAALGAATFLPGLALQLPFAGAAYALARLLLRAASELGRLLSAALRTRLRAVAITLRPAGHDAPPRARLLAASASGRGPPAALVNA